MWGNHHTTTILSFLVAQIAAMMNLIQSDFHKSRNCPDTVMKKAFPPSLPPFSKGRVDDASVIFRTVARKSSIGDFRFVRGGFTFMQGGLDIQT